MHLKSCVSALTVSLALVFPVAGQMPATPIITEFLAENMENLPDEDGDHSDWIEIFNPTTEAVAMEGYSLTDDPAVPGKWLFPAVEIQPGHSLVVFASGKDRIDPTSVLHTNFALENGGEYLALYAPDLTDPISAFQPEYPRQHADVSYGISGQDPGSVGFLRPPTPNATNGTAFQGLVGDTKFSPTRGFVPEGTLIEITSATEGAVIHYTVDGSEPTESHGMIYSEPVALTGTTVLRAAAFRDGYIRTNVDTHTYVIAATVKTQAAMNPLVVEDPAYAEFIDAALGTTLPALSLAVDEAAFFGPDGIHTNFNLGGPDAEVPLSIEYFSPSDSGDQFHIDGGIRIHGGNARSHPKKPFRLYFRGRYGETRLRFPLFEGSRVDRFDQLVLRPGGHDSWSLANAFGTASTDIPWHGTLLRDQFLRQTENDLGLLSPKGKHVHVYINGQYWGVYDLHERPNAAYFADYLGGEEEDYDVVHHPEFFDEDYSLVDGNDEAWSALLALAQTQATTEEEFEKFAEFIDIEDYVDSLIVRMWSGDYDWCGPVLQQGQDVTVFGNKNWYAGRRSRNGEGKFRFFTWDAEMSMGLHLLVNLGDGVPPQRVLDFDLSAVDDPGSPVQPYDSLRRYEPFKRLFADRMQEHLFGNGVLAEANSQARMDTFIDRLDLPMIAESARWGQTADDGTVFTRDDHWRPEVDWLRNTFLTERNDRMVAQFRNRGIFPVTDAPTFAQDGGVVSEGFALTISSSTMGDVYYTTDGSDPATLPTYTTLQIIQSGRDVEWLVPTESNGGLNFGTSDATGRGGAWTVPTAAPQADFWFQDRLSPGLGWEVGDNAFSGLYSTRSFMREVMFEKNATVLVRIPFSIGSQSIIDNLESVILRVKYDDGFVAFLNRQRISQGNAQDPTAGLLATETALEPREDAEAVIFQSFDITDIARTALNTGANLLAIQGLNASADSSDFLLVPQMELVSQARPAGPSPTARRYGGPIPIEENTNLKARFLGANGVWSAMTESQFVVDTGIVSGGLIVSEINYRPAAPSTPEELALTEMRSDFEFIELYNRSNREFDLTGASFIDGVQFTFPETRLGPGEHILVVNREETFNLRYGTDPTRRIAGTFEGGSQLSDGGERITLVTVSGDLIFSFEYGDSDPWPAEADGDGHTLVHRPGPVANPENVGDWAASLDSGGHPGRREIDTYAEWRELYFVTPEDQVDEISGPQADADGDGWTNLLEYLFGTHPRRATQSVDPVRFGGALIDNQPMTAFQFLRRLGVEDVTIDLEFSADLTEWQPVPFDEETATVQANLEGRENVQIPLTEALSEIRYGRLRAAYTP